LKNRFSGRFCPIIAHFKRFSDVAIATPRHAVGPPMRAYKTLTDDEANENWRKYGNPDGRRVVRLGFSIPKWFVDRQNSMFVLLVYSSIFTL
jgi:hypothetical protein